MRARVCVFDFTAWWKFFFTCAPRQNGSYFSNSIPSESNIHIKLNVKCLFVHHFKFQRLKWYQSQFHLLENRTPTAIVQHLQLFTANCMCLFISECFQRENYKCGFRIRKKRASNEFQAYRKCEGILLKTQQKAQ